MDLKFGKKRLCAACNTTFFDMNNIKPKCPKCGEVFIFACGSGKWNKTKAAMKDKNVKKDNDDLQNKDDIILSEDVEFEDAKDLIDSI